MRASKLQPALLGGLLTGVLSALPFISAGNCLCCLWVIGGGALAAYLLQQNQAPPIDPGDGAVVGLLSGLVGALIASLLAIPLQMLMGPMGADFLGSIIEQAGDAPPELQQLLEQFATGGFGIAAMVVGLIVNLVVFSIFGTLGGLIGQSVFRKPPSPATPVFLEPMPPSQGM